MFTLSTVNISNEHEPKMFIENENDAIFHCVSCHLNDLALENCNLQGRNLFSLQEVVKV